MFYRLRKRINTFRFGRAARGVYRTPPTPCVPGADCTIHTMLGHADFLMYLVAIKSFFRFRPVARVAAHSDGSLTPEDEAMLREHVPGIRVVTREEADDRAKSRLNPYLLEWRARDASWRRVLDTELFCETPRRMIIDSDILTIHKPDAVLEWVAGSGAGRPLMFGAPDGPPTGPIPETPGPKHIQTVFREKLAGVAAGSGRLPEYYQGATSGYYGCGAEVSLEEIERVLRAGIAAGVPMAEWGGEQCLVVYLLSTSNPVRLDPRKYANFAPEVVPRLSDVAVAHFYGTFRYYGGTYRRLAATAVREMSR